MVTDEMVEKAVTAALRADIIPADDPKYEGVRINEYLSYTPAEAVELGVHLTQTTEDGKPRWHGFTDIMGDEYDDTNRAILRPVIRAALEAALSAAEPVATVAEMGAGGIRVLMPHPPGSADHLSIGTKLYAAPPAPSVAVMALEWNSYREPGQSARIKAVHPFGEYRIINNSRDGELWSPELGGVNVTFDGWEEAKAAAQADYEARIRSALSAQVQDVALLRPEEQKAQASRCGCKGSDDYCPCQNVADAETIRVRAAEPAKQEDDRNEAN